jgi:hypothetical protein
MIPKVGDQITRTEWGERVIYRVTDVNEATRTVKMEPVSVGGCQAIGLPVKATIDRRHTVRRKDGGR